MIRFIRSFSAARCCTSIPSKRRIDSRCTFLPVALPALRGRGPTPGPLTSNRAPERTELSLTRPGGTPGPNNELEAAPIGSNGEFGPMPCPIPFPFPRLPNADLVDEKDRRPWESTTFPIGFFGSYMYCGRGSCADRKKLLDGES